MKRYPFSALAAAMRLTEAHALRELGISGRTGQEYRRDGMSERVADRLAVKAGLHPVVVWPEYAEEAWRRCAACMAPFVLNAGRGGQNRRYCSAQCRSRETMRRLRATPAGAEANRVAVRRYKADVRAIRARNEERNRERRAG